MPLPAALRRAPRKAKSIVPADLRRVARAVRSLRGAEVITGLPRLRRALVIAPHPDDETLGCGGTIALLTDADALVTVLWATDGEATMGSPLSPQKTGRRRRTEAQRAAVALQAESRFLALPDGKLSEHTDELSTGFAEAIADLRPEVVFAPWLLDGTADHRAVAEGLGMALAGASAEDGPDVWGYEVWTALVPNRMVEITPVIERKREALAAHKTAALALDLSAGPALARWRSLQTLGGRGWAEAFLATSAAGYLELAAELDEGS
jgi:N-acetylglucosamine malate deacetylase 1